jgi:hypothetical protein
MNIKPLLAALLITVSSTSALPAIASDLTSSLGSLTSLASGDSSALVDAALSKMGLSDAIVSQAKPIINGTISKGKEIMDSYGYNGESTEGMSEDDATKMKQELSSEVASSESSLSSVIPADALGPVMELVKSQLGSGLF